MTGLLVLVGRASLAKVQTDFTFVKLTLPTAQHIVLNTFANERVFSALGKFNERSKLKSETTLEISGVREEDVGKFICTADGTSYEHTLLVVSGEQKT